MAAEGDDATQKGKPQKGKGSLVKGKPLLQEDTEEDMEEETESEEDEEVLVGDAVPQYLGKTPDILAVRVIRAFRSRTIRQNKWRTIHHNLTGDNIDIDACIASGSYGAIFRAENKDTRRNGEPGTKYAIKVMKVRIDTQAEGEWEPTGKMGEDYSPVLSRTSEASIEDVEEMMRKSLTAKRSREFRTSLQYIKTGHPNVCNMEGWAEFDILAHNYSMLIMELCDYGDIHDIANNFRKKKEFIPEGFMWHTFEQILDGLTFLHGEHPDYRKLHEFQKNLPVSTVVRDLKPNNVFVQSPPKNSPPNTYPSIKIGDFGESIHLPLDGNRNFMFGNSVCEPPDTKMSAKYDVWSTGAIIYFLAKSGKFPNKGLPENEDPDVQTIMWGQMGQKQRKELVEKRSDPARFELIDDHLTQDLNDQIRWVMDLDRHTRPTALEAWRRIQKFNNERKRLMYRALPDWSRAKPDRVFQKFELVQLDFKIQEAEGRGFLFQYGGGLPIVRTEKKRALVEQALEHEKALTRAKEKERKAKLDEYIKAGSALRANIAWRKQTEIVEIDKIQQERKRFGGWLEHRDKRRKFHLRKQIAHGAGEA